MKRMSRKPAQPTEASGPCGASNSPCTCADAAHGASSSNKTSPSTFIPSPPSHGARWAWQRALASWRRRRAARYARSMIKVLAAALTAMTISAAAPARAQSTWDHVARVVVIGDLHGDYAKLHDMLSQAGLIDAHDAWSGGAAHLVQLGDVPDRAPDTRRILDLLMRLEPQARHAGGFVHVLIGNHEAMNMEGDLRYTTPGEFAAFTDRDSPRRRDAYYAALVTALQAHPPAGGLPVFDQAHRAQFDAAHTLGWAEHRAAWSPDGVYGRWGLTHRALIRIDDTLYLHGGLGPQFLSFHVHAFNKTVLGCLRH